MPVGVKEHIIRLYVAVDDALSVDVPQGASQLSYPEPHGVLGERFPRDVESQISAAHEIDNQIPVGVSLTPKNAQVKFAYMYSMSWKLYRKLQMNGWFTCSSIRRSRMMLRTLSERTTGWQESQHASGLDSRIIFGQCPTFVFPNVFEGERQACVFPLDDPDFAKGTSTDDP